jgi:hypothetical protein
MNNSMHRQAMRDQIRLNSQSDGWLLAEIDVDNDGAPDSVLKYKRNGCNNYLPDLQRHAVWVFVLDRKSQSVDIRKSQQILGKVGENDVGITSATFDVVRFRGLNYIDTWSNEGDLSNMKSMRMLLSVYQHRADSRTLVCRYEYLKKLGVQ